MDKETLIGMLNSKTINFNVLATIAVVWAMNSYGVPMTPEVAASAVAVVYGAINVLLRFATKKSLPEKGVSVPNPVYVQEFVKQMVGDKDNLEELHAALKELIKKKKIEKKLAEE